MFIIRYMGIGEVLDQGISVLKENVGLMLKIALLTIVPAQFLISMLNITLYPGLAHGDASGIVADPSALVIVGILSILLFFVVNPLANAAMMHAAACTYLSRPTTLGECMKHGLRRWPALMGTSFLVGLATMLGFILLIVPGIIFALWYALAQQVVVLEETSGGDAMSRSKALMKNNKGRMFALIMIVSIISGMGSGALNTLPQFHLRLLGQAVMTGVTTMFASAVFVVFYFSCRCQLENFDLEMLADSVADEDADEDAIDDVADEFSIRP